MGPLWWFVSKHWKLRKWPAVRTGHQLTRSRRRFEISALCAIVLCGRKHTNNWFGCRLHSSDSGSIWLPRLFFFHVRSKDLWARTNASVVVCNIQIVAVFGCHDLFFFMVLSRDPRAWRAQ